MARTVRDTTMDTLAARLRLKARPKPYWRVIEPGRHLGYYKGAAGGSWIARRYRGGGKYEEEVLGAADDTNAAGSGGGGLPFAEAQEKARRWFAEQAAAATDGGPVRGYTVAGAFDDYLKAYTAGQTKGGGRALAETTRAAKLHVLPALGSVKLTQLTPARLREWHRKLAEAPARTRGGELRGGKAPDLRKNPELARQRRATANRILTILKAALNHAYRDGKASSDDAWRRVSPFQNVDAPVIRYLDEAECQRLVNATAADFRPMVRAALLTGLRYGELRALLVKDVNADAGTVTVRRSKGGKARHVVLTDEARALFEAARRGKSGSALLFVRPDGEAWRASHQIRRLADASKAAKIKPAVSFHVLRHTHGSLLAMQGVPMRVIADQLGHADTRTTERHYAHLSPSYVADTIRENFPKLGIVPGSNVRPLDAKRGRA